MKFKLLPVTDIMLELYESPVNPDRFSNYLKILQGNSKGDIKIPVTFYNPMGKALVLNKLTALKNLQAEALIKETLKKINEDLSEIMPMLEISVSLALADDVGGGWTNRYTTDYESKFRAADLLKSGFCNPLFWVSETYSAAKIVERTLDYCYRTVFRLTSPSLITLEDHMQQETVIAGKHPIPDSSSCQNFELLDAYYQKHKHTDQHSLIFNFLYGDDACNSLGYRTYGIPDEFAGYEYAKALVVEKLELNREFVLK